MSASRQLAATAIFADVRPRVPPMRQVRIASIREAPYDTAAVKPGRRLRATLMDEKLADNAAPEIGFVFQQCFKSLTNKPPNLSVNCLLPENGIGFVLSDFAATTRALLKLPPTLTKQAGQSEPIMAVGLIAA
jgi:hypothetical protein